MTTPPGAPYERPAIGIAAPFIFRWRAPLSFFVIAVSTECSNIACHQGEVGMRPDRLDMVRSRLAGLAYALAAKYAMVAIALAGSEPQRSPGGTIVEFLERMRRQLCTLTISGRFYRRLSIQKIRREHRALRSAYPWRLPHGSIGRSIPHELPIAGSNNRNRE
jgi:hypothetical protein